MAFAHWLLVASLVVVATTLPSTSDVEVAWQNFKATHGKQYKNLHEEAARKAIFTRNFDMITEHNKRYDDGLVSYYLKVTPFTDLTKDEIVKTYTGNKAGKHPDNVGLYRPDPNVKDADSIDWREKGAVTEVMVQDQCGSCWAFAATGALEGQWFIKSGNLVSLSEQNLMDCSSAYDNAGCDGGWAVNSFMYVHDTDGIDSEASYPYEAVDGQCRYDPSANVTSTSGYNIIEAGNEDQLKSAVSSIGPIAVAIDAGQDDFGYWGGGIYYNEACVNGLNEGDYLNHAVLVVGYGSDGGEDYWIVKNSWGTEWGEAGYVRMARNRNNNCGTAAQASYPINY